MKRNIFKYKKYVWYNFQVVDNFSLKMFKIRFLRTSKCLKTAWNTAEQPVELSQKLLAGKSSPYSQQSHVASNVGDYTAVIIESI